MAERERTRIAEDIHDGALQNIIAIRRNLEELIDENPDSPLLNQTDALLRDTTGALRGTVMTLHPQVLAQLGLSQALHELLSQYRNRSGLSVHASLADIGHVPHQSLLYGTARELLANVTRHAHAANVWVTLSRTAQGISLDVVDDGSGFDPEIIDARVAHGHIGLASRSTQITGLGGSLTIQRARTSGTRIAVWVPIPAADPVTDHTDHTDPASLAAALRPWLHRPVDTDR